MRCAGNREWEALVNGLFEPVLAREARLEAAEAQHKARPDDSAFLQVLKESRFERDSALSKFMSLVIPKLRYRAAGELGQGGLDPECIAEDAVTSLYCNRARLQGSAWRYLLVAVRNQSWDLKKEMRSWISFEEEVAEASRTFKAKRELFEARGLINEWFASLDDHLRDVLTLRLQGLSIMQVASELGISRRMAKRWTSALMTALSAWLKTKIR
jgi:DNA-directed RNA polymerase specialized sigma24 family protein